MDTTHTVPYIPWHEATKSVSIWLANTLREVPQWSTGHTQDQLLAIDMISAARAIVATEPRIQVPVLILHLLEIALVGRQEDCNTADRMWILEQLKSLGAILRAGRSAESVDIHDWKAFGRLVGARDCGLIGNERRKWMMITSMQIRMASATRS